MGRHVAANAPTCTRTHALPRPPQEAKAFTSAPAQGGGKQQQQAEAGGYDEDEADRELQV